MSAAGDRRGFALAMVVLMLFAIAVAGATGFQVVSAEFTLAQQNRDGQEALAVARAGLQRFLGEQVGQIGDSVSYSIGDGVATVTARKVVERDSLNHLYYIRSVGQVADVRTPLLPATRTVGTYAWHRLNPIPLKAAVLLTGGDVRLYLDSSISGLDHATTSDCAGGGTAGTYGLGTAGSITIAESGTYYEGSPMTTGSSSRDLHYNTYQQTYDTVGVRWDILQDPSFPVDFDGTMPNWGSLPSDSFPIVRYNGDLTAWGGYYSGRGVLIVTGRLTIYWDFEWDGIILAGSLYRIYDYEPEPVINGMIIGGLDAANPASRIYGGDLYYHSCNVYAANRSLSYLEVVDNALFELNY